MSLISYDEDYTSDAYDAMYCPNCAAYSAEDCICFCPGCMQEWYLCECSDIPDDVRVPEGL